MGARRPEGTGGETAPLPRLREEAIKSERSSPTLKLERALGWIEPLSVGVYGRVSAARRRAGAIYILAHVVREVEGVEVTHSWRVSGGH